MIYHKQKLRSCSSIGLDTVLIYLVQVIIDIEGSILYKKEACGCDEGCMEPATQETQFEGHQSPCVPGLPEPHSEAPSPKKETKSRRKNKGLSSIAFILCVCTKWEEWRKLQCVKMKELTVYLMFMLQGLLMIKSEYLALLASTYKWDYLVFLFPCLAYFT